MDKEQQCLSLINRLPDELVREIYDYLPGLTKMVLSKTLYNKHHSCVKRSITTLNLYDNYVRDMIRQDFSFIFNSICTENLKYWIKPKKCTYKNKTFATYSDLLENLCFETNSTKCRNELKEVFENAGLSKNRHKKNIVKIIKREWTN
jgi:hypothetical protein